MVSDAVRQGERGRLMGSAYEGRQLPNATKTTLCPFVKIPSPCYMAHVLHRERGNTSVS